MNRVWVITGASGGIASVLIGYILKERDSVACFTRQKRKLDQQLESENVLVIEVDLKSDDSVCRAIEKTMNQFGRIDVVVNNAGYDLLSYVEELNIQQLRECFEINLLASIRLMKCVLPYMRNKEKGSFINISSICGTLYSYPGSAAYNMSKAAMDSLSKTLSSEIEKYGIFSTSLVLGQFRTDFLQNVLYGQDYIEEYQQCREGKVKSLKQMNHNQRGDVEKVCSLIIKISTMKCPPKEMFVGNDAYELAYNRAISILNNLKHWEKVSRNMDIEEV